MIKQRTIRESIKASGIGLHSGKKSNIEILPAPPGTGIIFRRIDLKPNVEIRAHALNVHKTELSTEIGNGEASVGTIEHLIAAFAGMGIDNCYINIDHSEVPIMDGSSSDYIFLLQSCGVKTQDIPKKYLRVIKPIEYYDQGRRGSFLPYNGYKITMEIDFDHPIFHDKKFKSAIEFSPTSFIKDLSRSRTFGFQRDIERLQSSNLALGGSFMNAVLLDDEKVVNKGGLRHPLELVRHKILDAIGDLHLIGYNIIGEFSGYKSGHTINNKLIRRLLEQSDSFVIEEFDSFEDIPFGYRSIKDTQ